MAAFSAPAKSLMALAKAAATEPDAVVLCDEKRWSFDAQGRSTFTIHRIYVARTAAGARDWGTLDARWEPWHEGKPNVQARVISAEGAETMLDPKTLAEVPVGERNGTYSDARILRAILPGVAPGSVVEEQTVVAESSVWFAAGIAQRTYFGFSVPCEHSSVVLEAPSTMHLKYTTQLLPDMKTVRSEANGRLRVEFTHGPMKAVEDVEPYQPFDVPRWPHLTFSTGQSWKAIAAAYHAISENQLRGAKVKDLLPKPLPRSPKEIGDALLARLHKEVRYTGIEFAEASIVPRTPAETLQRKYGDCKDQAALLVAMLREAGVPAELALLDAGCGQDVEPDTPGMGVFNHAIVHVPGTPDLWADPTDEYARFNELPIGDQNRFALLIREEGVMVKTPEAKSADNGFLERREFVPSELGKAQVTETTEAWGAVERGYRDSYTSPDAKKLKESFQSYAKSSYLSEVEPKFQVGDVSDLSKRFLLKLEMQEAARGTTTTTDAVVAIPVSYISNRIPESLRPSGEEKKQEARKTPFVLYEPHTGEWLYRIACPPGFRVASMPESGTVQLGPASIKKKFSIETDGSVTAVIHLDTGKRIYQAAEVEEFRRAYKELSKAPMLMVRFEQVGQTMLAQGKIRDALTEFRKLVVVHPKEALHHMQIANAYLAAGAAEAARKEARAAIALEPKSSSALSTLGWMLQHDLVGRRFGKGASLAEAEEAYRTALKLKPDDYDTRVNLAVMLEHAPNGERYANNETLKRAIAEYELMEGKLGNGYQYNVFWALLWAGRYRELEEKASKWASDPTVDALLLAATAARVGPKEAVRLAARRIVDEKPRTAALLAAGQNLFKLRVYKPGAALVELASAGSPQAATLRASLDLIANARHFEEFMGKASTPEAAYQRLFPVLFIPTLPASDYKASFVEGSEYVKPDTMKVIRSVIAPYRAQILKSGLPLAVATDLALGGMQLKSDGDENGYRIRAEMSSAAGSKKTTAFAVKQGEEYRILCMDEASTIGERALRLVEEGKLGAARRWLDWGRELEQLKGGEDPLSGPVFPRFWTRGSEAPAETIRYAAASLMAHTQDVKRAIPILLEGRAKLPAGADSMRFDVALAAAYTEDKDYASLLKVAQDLLKRYPDAETAFAAVARALANLKRREELEALAQERLKRIPDDHTALATLAGDAMGRGEFAKAIEFGRKIIANGSQNAGDLNDLAWAMLLNQQATAEALELAQKSVFASNGNAFGPLHTQAALLAEAGKVAEAREVILKAMEVAGQEEPESNTWYVFGRMAEQLGIEEAAVAAYKRVERPASGTSVASTWVLADRRMKAISAGKR